MSSGSGRTGPDGTTAAAGDDRAGGDIDQGASSPSEKEKEVISKQVEAEILRLHRIEKWRVGTICSELGVHRDTVQRVLRQHSSAQGTQRTPRRCMIDPYRGFIAEVLARHPRLRASRLYAMCRERGYTGRPDHFRHLVARMRPQPQREAFLRLHHLPGQQAQVDFAHFDHIQIGNRRWPLIALVVVLSWSRRIYLRFMPSMRMPWFLLAQTEALFAFGGVPKRMLYDNAKVVTLERHGDTVRFHAEFLDFANHYGFEPRVAAPYRGNEKGGVERAIRYIREAFFSARSYDDLDDLNRQARLWCDEEARQRRWMRGSDKSVAVAFQEERALLTPLPPDVFPTHERVEVTVAKVPYIRFDKNDYSVPHELVGHVVSVVASESEVRILKDGQVAAEHRRCFEQHRTIERTEHLDQLWQAKHQARRRRAQDRLTRAAPSTALILAELGRRGENLGATCSMLIRLLDLHGAARVEKAAQEALAQGSPHPHSIVFLIDRMLKAEGLAPTVPVALPDRPGIRDVVVRPHDLERYDELIRSDADDDAGGETDATS